MSRLTAVASYGASAGAVANGFLTMFSPEEWSAISLITGIFLAVMTFAVNLYYKHKLVQAKIAALSSPDKHDA